jgi:hypothetical protein
VNPKESFRLVTCPDLRLHSPPREEKRKKESDENEEINRSSVDKEGLVMDTRRVGIFGDAFCGPG